MGTAFLKMDQSRVKWRFKLAAAFDKSQAAVTGKSKKDRASRSERWALFLLPFITVIRVRLAPLSATEDVDQALTDSGRSRSGSLRWRSRYRPTV